MIFGLQGKGHMERPRPLIKMFEDLLLNKTLELCPRTRRECLSQHCRSPPQGNRKGKKYRNLGTLYIN